MHQTVYSGFKLDKHTEIGDIADGALVQRSLDVLFGERDRGPR